MSKFAPEKLATHLINLSTVNLQKLQALLKEQYNVTMSWNIGEDESPLRQDDRLFQIRLCGVQSQKKIACIKMVRQIEGLSLKESKMLVDDVADNRTRLLSSELHISKALSYQREFAEISVVTELFEIRK